LWSLPFRPNTETESSTTSISWLPTINSRAQTLLTDGKSEPAEWNKSTTMSLGNITAAGTSGETNRGLTTQPTITMGSILVSTRKSKPKVTTRRPTTRFRLSQMSTTTEVVTESAFALQTTSSCLNVTEYKITDGDLIALNETDKNRLRKLCWETMFGQELVKLTVMDFVLVVASTLGGDFIRALIVR